MNELEKITVETTEDQVDALEPFFARCESMPGLTCVVGQITKSKIDCIWLSPKKARKLYQFIQEEIYDKEIVDFDIEDLQI